ncbi:winged helix-turn-helix transcriptional regulator [Mucilaginibacter rubeus]|uniref:Winged helix-turn-helix transcriptional regulator n=1 Tax=Mucilaginibacter rubeus TaxID=2027860 RepID=A0AAE6MK70_9SPHI|nr:MULTISPECIES: MarR family winged helix-turn-helix transcriptional regulator [Mucilaginibacter]QEM06453.1 winged helix-turn-helix transcriptional regulator [Mucilaginibacter rubeus]QEM19039.1 winged helix-turn-helix transcriptional regulator [Mucilaginibacter gossypii]QTE44420.1 winged helix-turn-helix transcriptional regulator [Mucilaginibacter rubeus]QTE51019.1 winged helix-turn-helix transcriptional regulator [Mucilaginibacter rubeus]QTE56102.1 winged helix-turn-helix transcriptional regu
MQLLLSKNLRRLSRLYTRTIARELPVFQSEYFIEILMFLASRTSPATQKELADYLQVDKSRMVIMVDELTRQEYVFTEINPRDRREHFVFLTEHGNLLVPIIRSAIDKVDTVLYKELNKELLDCFHAILVKMEQNLNQTSS